MYRLNVLIVVALQLFSLSCKNPFFPRIGEPLELATGMRATPQGVINQLIQSYDKRSIETFRDLFPEDGSFRFFIAPDYFNDNPSRYLTSVEERDPRLKFLESSDIYYFWTQEREIENHAKLFSQAEFIEFIDKPGIESVRPFVDNGDSLTELLVTGGWLQIGRKVDNTIEIYSTAVDRQVFLLGKDEDALWVILKWYDFSTDR